MIAQPDMFPDCPEDHQVKKIARLAIKQQKLEEDVAHLELQLSEYKEALRKVQEEELPEAMTEAGVVEFKLPDGTKVSVKPYYSASIKGPEPITWLESNGHGDLVKRKFQVDFGKATQEEANQLRALLNENGYTFSEAETVHPMTLKAFVKEQIEAGNPIPTDLFNIYVGQKAVIKKG